MYLEKNYHFLSTVGNDRLVVLKLSRIGIGNQHPGLHSVRRTALMSFAHSRLCPFYLRHGVRLMSLHTRALPTSRPSLEEENADYVKRKEEVAEFFSLPRFRDIKRPYTPADVASKQGSMPVLPLPSTLLADKLYATLSKAADAKQPVLTMGAIDPVQMTQMARHQDVVYVSGWAASSLLTTANNEVGPDLG